MLWNEGLLYTIKTCQFMITEIFQKPADISYGFGSPTKDWNLSKSSPSQEDGKLRLENNQLRIQVKQFQLDLQAEQGKVV